MNPLRTIAFPAERRKVRATRLRPEQPGEQSPTTRGTIPTNISGNRPEETTSTSATAGLTIGEHYSSAQLLHHGQQHPSVCEEDRVSHRASGRSASRTLANHDDVDEGGPQLLAQVNVASATSSHGQVPQTGWGSVQESAPSLNVYGSDVIKLTHQSLRSWLKAEA